MTTTFLNLPPHLLPSSTPPLSGTPSGQNTSTPPPLLTSTALWYTQWTKYLLPPQLHHSLAPQVAPTLLSGGPSGALWRPKWHSLTHTLVALSGASRGNLHCSLAPSNDTNQMDHILLLTFRRQMLRSKVFTVQKTVDDLNIRIDLLDHCSKTLSNTKHRRSAVGA